MQDFDDSRFVRFLYARNCDVGNVMSHVQWLTGSPAAAARTAAATIEYALMAKHELSLSNAVAWACLVSFWNGSNEDCGRYVAMLSDLAARHGIVTWRPVAIFFRGALACAQNGDPADGVDDLDRAVAEFRAIHHWARMPFYLAVLADALARCGRLVDAAATIQAALDRARAQNERWCAPEVLRIRAAILTAEGRPQDAEAVLVDAMALAREIGALSWRLRAANDLAKLWRGRSRADDARKLLLPIHGEFTEGFATRDLVVAADLLASFARPGDGEAAPQPDP